MITVDSKWLVSYLGDPNLVIIDALHTGANLILYIIIVVVLT